MKQLCRKQFMDQSIWVDPPKKARGYRREASLIGLWILLALATLSGVFLFISDAYGGEPETRWRKVRMDEITQGSLLVSSDEAGVFRSAPMLKTDVDMRVSGMILRTSLKQTFSNTGGEWVEGIYVFPLPENAAVDHLRMQIGERIIEGQIKERNEAKRTYEQAKAQGKKTSLIEQERPNLFTNSVANIGPHETIVIEIEYQQTLRYDQGEFHLRFPMAITPRYIPGKALSADEQPIHFEGNGWSRNSTQVKDASRITPHVFSGGRKNNPVSIRVELDAGFPLQRLQSRYHGITQTQHGLGKLTINLTEGEVPSDRDFELVWVPETRQMPRAALFTESREDADYHFVMLMPPTQITTGNTGLPREVIYIIDTSGSMAGTSIEQARQALLLSLDRLTPSDRFNIIEFNSITNALFKTAVPADSTRILEAKHFVNHLRADGGTEMAPALRAALNKSESDGYVRQVIFLTDGSVGNESELFKLISQRLGNSRLFTVGIGSAPNSHFMRRAAQFGRGTFTYIGDIGEVQEKMQQLFSKLQSPVMTDLAVSFAQDVNMEIWPERLPDLYLGEPLLISIRTEPLNSALTISGKQGGTPWQESVPLQGGMQKNGVGAVWARSKIASLMDRLHEGGDRDEIREAVIEVALSHHLVSKYTSLVAVDVTPSRPADKHLNGRNLKVNLPHGQQHEKIFGKLAHTATPARLHLLVGFGLLLVLMFWRYLPILRQRIIRASSC